MLKIRMLFFFSYFVGQKLINKVFVGLGGISMGFLPGLFLHSIHPVRERMGSQDGRKSLGSPPFITAMKFGQFGRAPTILSPRGR